MFISLEIWSITEKNVMFACIYMLVLYCAVRFFECVRRDANITNDDVIQIIEDSLKSTASIPITWKKKYNTCSCKVYQNLAF